MVLRLILSRLNRIFCCHAGIYPWGLDVDVFTEFLFDVMAFRALGRLEISAAYSNRAHLHVRAWALLFLPILFVIVHILA